MQGNTLVKLVIAAAVLFLLWKEVLPRMTKNSRPVGIEMSSVVSM